MLILVVFCFISVTQSSASINAPSDEEQKMKIKNKLKKYLNRRPSFTELEDKGIIKGLSFFFQICWIILNCYIVPYIVYSNPREFVPKFGLKNVDIVMTL